MGCINSKSTIKKPSYRPTTAKSNHSSGSGNTTANDKMSSNANGADDKLNSSDSQPNTRPSTGKSGKRDSIVSGSGGKSEVGGAAPKKKAPFIKDKFDPRVLQKYEVKALIGRGSFSKVVRVENKKTRQPYAIKMIEMSGGRELFHAEVAVLQRVAHENVVRLYEVLETRDRAYLVMELATGGELFDRIVARGHFTEADGTRCLKMVLEGVAYLHKLGITHRDLKPENLLFYHPGADSKMIITDFGLSCCRKSGQNQLMRTTCGTPEYIAPEILIRKPYTNAVDMWAIGVITYILLSGTMPFDDENKTRLYRSIIRAQYSFRGSCWEDVSPEAKDFIRKLLVVNPEVRLKAAEASQHPWIVSGASTASNKNLVRTISQNLIERASSRGTRSSKSNRSARSAGLARSTRSSQKSIRPITHRITPKDVKEIDVIHKSCSNFSSVTAFDSPVATAVATSTAAKSSSEKTVRPDNLPDQ